jgi:predicted nuclease with RNAse H fold
VEVPAHPSSRLALGLDLTNGPARASTCALLRWAAGTITLLDLAEWHTDEELLAQARAWQPALVAVDAPLSFPLGLDCLELDHPCVPQAAGQGRAAERALSREGIACYYTTKRSVIKPMVYRARGLAATWDALGCPVIEIYPYAAKVRLWGKPLPRKSTPTGRVFYQTRLAALVQGLADPAHHLYTHDETDAILAGYTGVLHLAGAAEAVGDPLEGLIWVPPRSGRLAAAPAQ